MGHAGTYSVCLINSSTSVPQSVRIGHLMVPTPEISRPVTIPLKLIGPQGTSIVRRSPRVCRIPYKSGQLFSHFFKKKS